MLVHITHPCQEQTQGEYNTLPAHLNPVIGVLHHNNHCAVMEINISDKKVVVLVYDGLN
jgi:hypothetical protein